MPETTSEGIDLVRAVTLAALVAVAFGGCASSQPQVAKVETRWDDSRQTDVVYLDRSNLTETWDGRVEIALQAATNAETALLTVERRSEEFHYKDCRTMAISLDPEGSQPVTAAYRSDLDLEVDDKLETFQATLSPDLIADLASSPHSAVILCEDRYELGHAHRVRIADFVEKWTGTRPEVPQRNAAGEAPAAS